MKKQEKTLLSALFQRLFIIITVSLPCCAEASNFLTIKNQVFFAHTGDYVVFAKGSQRFFLAVKSVDNTGAWIELIEFPSLCYTDRCLLENGSWKLLVHQLTSHKKVFLIHLPKNEAHSVFSLDQESNVWNFTSPGAAPIFLNTLLSLELSPAPQQLIKTQGKDRRPWSPTVSVQGEKTSNLSAQAWHALWPKGSSLLSDKNVLIYFTSTSISPFPLWISIETSKGHIIVRAIELGKDITSPYPSANLTTKNPSKT
ncbi:hypothetical protein CP10139811_0264 [Chlamydia ibidis]|uniref:Uncharacterized protein n=2 Tax=Chlamydia ibidis TaxID=1405396 RepID=S7J3R9_9CHLA|nr:hypothetical protein [Chlamydia ibidis]EPP35069.1 hypothetical protein CP10139811_0264 [Chlamydia ibidis]EQM62651.1 hypothetical protein H359_0711 [Chlamydia ibidis 10-1398/6]